MLLGSVVVQTSAEASHRLVTAVFFANLVAPPGTFEKTTFAARPVVCSSAMMSVAVVAPVRTADEENFSAFGAASEGLVAPTFDCRSFSPAER